MIFGVLLAQISNILHFCCRSLTKVFHQYFLASHYVLQLIDNSIPVLQDLLLLGIEKAKPLGVNASSLLRQLNLDILNSGLLVDINAGWELLDRLFRSCECCQSKLADLPRRCLCIVHRLVILRLVEGAIVPAIAIVAVLNCLLFSTRFQQISGNC